MLTIKRTTQFKKDFKRIIKQGVNIQPLMNVIETIAKEEILDEKFCDHPLKGEWQGFRECHIKPDWLLIYLIDKGDLILTLSRTGSHSDLFNS
ncbi:MAG: type II toxin-antitoxin system YafQ family toxin [Selenomonadaceae bacterium]|nr:type II toxin-antitoxin system YafQ family toxin [Selenomonadaceae bacterium]MBQ7722950.1 type II toxin-antitoxin system YafQ family toxin [Selenomonadaceae bacterium]